MTSHPAFGLMTPRLSKAFRLLGLVLSISSFGMAQEFTAGLGEWIISSNWNTNAVPTATDSVLIGFGRAAQITTGYSAFALSVDLGSSGDTGTLNILNGNLSTTSAFIGHQNLEVGIATVSGSNSQ